MEKFSEVPINYDVNSVFSKYNINPLKNINFGPMQYGETWKMQIILKNEGIFDFNFSICDFKNTEAKKAIKDEE